MTPASACALVLWLPILTLIRPSPSIAQADEPIRDRAAQEDGLPLLPERTARFRVSEGTWMSLDVSPDGQTIVFDLLGHLYTLPIGGGTARQVTSGLAVHRQPRFSPDGRLLAFVSDRNGQDNVWIAEADGRNPRRLSDLSGFDDVGSVTSPTWSPDGRAVVVAQRLGAVRRAVERPPATIAEFGFDPRHFMWLLGAYEVESGRMRWVSDTAIGHARSVLGPAYDPRGGALYVAADLDPAPWQTRLAGWRLARMSPTTGRPVLAMPGNAARAGLRPMVSPDGRWLVYASSSGSHLGLRLRDLSTEAERWLVREVLDDPSGTEQFEPREPVPGYAFTPDSRAVVAAYGGQIHRIELATGRATRIPFVADVERDLAPRTVKQFTLPDSAVWIRSVLHPALSPDGRWVAFGALDRIWLMALDTAGGPSSLPRRLTPDSLGEFYPAWSPDGGSVVYTTWQDGVGGGLSRVRTTLETATRRVVLSTPERLTRDTARYERPAVSFHHDRIVAVRTDFTADGAPRSRPARPQLVWIPASGGAPTAVTALPPAANGPIYFTDRPDLIHVGLSSWSWDGANQGLAFAFKHGDGVVYGEAPPADVGGTLSPDHRRAFISVGAVLYEVSLSSRRDTLELRRAQGHPFGAPAVSARRWGVALRPRVSWSRNGRRAVFAQGGVLYVGNVRPTGWTTFRRVEVPLTITPDRPRGTIAFRGARLITMRGDEVIERGDLVVRDNRVAALGPAGRVTIPPDARIIEARGLTILPGYVDIHEHSIRPEGVHPEEFWWNLLELAYGITAIRDPAPVDNDIFSYLDRERAGRLVGPRVFSTGIVYGHPHPPIRRLLDAREVVARHARDFRTETFKVYGDTDNTDRLARQLLARALREAGLNGTIHNNGGDQALAAAIDGLTAIEHQPDIRTYDDFAHLMARSGVTYTHTYLSHYYGVLPYMIRRHGMPLEHAKVRRFAPPSSREAVCLGCSERYPAHAPDKAASRVRGAARMVRRGGHVGMGGHGNMVGLGFHYEMWAHALGEMPNHEVLRSATIVGATAIGHANDLGSLEPGKLADLQLLDKNPLQDIRNTTSIHYVMKNGRLYDANDLTEIWPRHRPLAPIYLFPGRSVESHPRDTKNLRGLSR